MPHSIYPMLAPLPQSAVYNKNKKRRICCPIIPCCARSVRQPIEPKTNTQFILLFGMFSVYLSPNGLFWFGSFFFCFGCGLVFGIKYERNSTCRAFSPRSPYKLIRMYCLVVNLCRWVSLSRVFWVSTELFSVFRERLLYVGIMTIITSHYLFDCILHFSTGAYKYTTRTTIGGDGGGAG